MEKHYPPYMFPPPVSPFRTTYYDCLVVVDFEATCEDNKNSTEHKPLRTERPEIIQFPAILIDVRNMTVVDTFDSYVKPVENPLLSQFCTNLTGITQDMVDEAATFPKVLRRFERWLKKYGLSNNGNGRTFAIVADGSFDMGHFLYKQTLISKIPFPSYAKRWVNIRTIFSKFYGQRWFSLKSVLDMLGQPFEGRQHNGLDDAKNISKVLMRLLMDGAIISQTEKIVLDVEEQEKNEAKILSDKHAGKYDLATVTSVPAYECIYIMAPNLLYRQPPETDFTPSNIDNKENNFPSMKAASATNYKKGPKQARGKRKHTKFVVETNLGAAEGAVSLAQEE